MEIILTVLVLTLFFLPWMMRSSGRLNFYPIRINEEKRRLNQTLADRRSLLEERLDPSQKKELLDIEKSADLAQTKAVFDQQERLLQTIQNQAALAKANQQVAQARKDLNQVIEEYNQALGNFPSSIIASSKGMKTIQTI